MHSRTLETNYLIKEGHTLSDLEECQFGLQFPKLTIDSDNETIDLVKRIPRKKFCKAHKKHYSGSRCNDCKQKKNSLARAKRVNKKLSNKDGFILGRANQVIWCNETIFQWWKVYEAWAISTLNIPFFCVRCCTSFVCNDRKILLAACATNMFCAECSVYVKNK